MSRTSTGALNEAKIVHHVIRLPESSPERDRYAALQVRALLSLIASEVAS